MAKTSFSSPRKLPTVKKVSSSKTSKKRASSGGGGGGGGNSGGRMGILKALVRLERFADNGKCPRSQVALLAGYHDKSPGFVKMLSTMKNKEELIEMPDTNTILIKTKGRTMVGDDEAPGCKPTNSEFHTIIKNNLKVPKYRLAFEFFVNGPHSKAELAEALGYPNTETAGFKKMLSSIRKDAHVESAPGTDMLQLDDAAYPLGRDHE